MTRTLDPELLDRLTAHGLVQGRGTVRCRAARTLGGFEQNAAKPLTAALARAPMPCSSGVALPSTSSLGAPARPRTSAKP